MLESIFWIAPAVAAAIYGLTPLVVRSAFRVAARCNLERITLEQLPQAISQEFRRRISEFADLGFGLVGVFDCGVLTNDTRSYVAYFCHHGTNEFANVTAMETPIGPASYFEISSRFADGSSIETNTNRVLPFLLANPAIRVFRFPSVDEPFTLLRLHRQLTEKYAPGLCALGEPRDMEIQRYARTMEGFGPRLAKTGHLQLTDDGAAYRLTWKGAARTAWLGLWPVTFIRKAVHRHAMHMEMQSLQTRTEAALQKA
ncbi:MAG TPA: hypothetical protein VMH31_00110 [Methylomirabilota bacterium]|nr:hypothetical protein [Methylomirabilota bacterium]